MAGVVNHTHQSRATSMLRIRIPGEHSRVTTFELFFDLVFVFAVTQLSHSLAGHLTREGALHMLMLLLALWGVWVYTAWATNWTDPNHLAVRVLLIGVMFGGLIMSASIPEAFDGRGLAFAIPLVAIQMLRSTFVLYAGRHDEHIRPNFQRILVWHSVSGAFWLAGAFAEGDTRVALWGMALLTEFAGPPVAFWVPGLGRSMTTDWTVEGSHFAERCGLFVIIALGESLLITGATFSALEWTAPVVWAMVAAFGASVSMWWIYFDLTADAASEIIGHSEDPGRIARMAYTYMHIPIVAGIIIAAVGDEIVLAHPKGDTELAVALTVVGGPTMFLVGYSLFKFSVVGRLFPAQGMALLALGALFAAYGALSPVALSVLATVILLAVAARGRLAHRGATIEMTGLDVAETLEVVVVTEEPTGT